jgi:SAM-dependent methyltransferase
MEQWIYKEMFDLEDKHWWYAARRQILTTVLQTIALPPSPKIIEIGSGTGGNLPMLAQFGQVEAIEPNSEGRAFIKQRGFPVQDGLLPDQMPVSPESVDMVAMLDVLEHVAEDAAILKAVHRLLKTGGYLVLTVPAFPSLWSYHDTQRHHHRRYTKKQLVERCLAAGFSIEKISYYNTLLFPVVVAVRFLNKLLGRQNASDEKLPSDRTNALLQAVFASERHWLKRASLPIGVSLLVVLRK